jgi:hypothetical protein
MEIVDEYRIELRTEGSVKRVYKVIRDVAYPNVAVHHE